MKGFAISNLAFKNHSIGDALNFFRSSQLEGLEVAPTMVWEEPLNASKKEKL